MQPKGTSSLLFAPNHAKFDILPFNLQFHFENNLSVNKSSILLSTKAPNLISQQESIIEIYNTLVEEGDLISFNYSICILNNNFSALASDIFLSVDLDAVNNSYWAPVGKSKYFINIKSESFSYTLLPLASGLVPLPKLNLGLFTTKNDSDGTINKINPVDTTIYKIFLKSDSSHIKV